MIELRPFSDADVPGLVDFWNGVGRALFDENVTSETSFRAMLATPGFAPERDVRLAYEGGELAGFASVFDENQWHSRYWSELAVRPGDDAAARTLVAWAEERARADAEPGAFLRVGASERAPAIARLLEERDFERVRCFFRMETDLGGAMAEVEWPSGVAVRTYRDDDAQPLWAAHNEAFADHWDHVEELFETWAHWTIRRPDFDPSLTFVATGGGEIAGYAVCRPRPGEPEIAVVDLLGVRPAWRKRGIALALLRHAFAAFGRRGFRKAILGVDSDSPTGAVRLYERAGMQVARRTDIYDLRL